VPNNASAVAGSTPAGRGDGVRNAFVTSGVIGGGCAKNSAAVAIGSGCPVDRQGGNRVPGGIHQLVTA
jgi:hypothetical protein